MNSESSLDDFVYQYDPTPDPGSPEPGVQQGWIVLRERDEGRAQMFKAHMLHDGSGGILVTTDQVGFEVAIYDDSDE